MAAILKDINCVLCLFAKRTTYCPSPFFFLLLLKEIAHRNSSASPAEWRKSAVCNLVFFFGHDSAAHLPTEHFAPWSKSLKKSLCSFFFLIDKCRGMKVLWNYLFCTFLIAKKYCAPYTAQYNSKGMKRSWQILPVSRVQVSGSPKWGRG